MATITLKGNKVHTTGSLPATGSKAPDFELTKTDLSHASLSDYSGKKTVLNVFPSIDTGTCAQSVRQFNEKAAKLDNTAVLCISKDLPFAQARFCGAEGIENVEMLSDFRDGNFGKAYNLEFSDGPLQSLLSRVVVVINENQEIVYTEQVPEIVDEPDYKAALEAITNA
ncbi:thiol peroxidase (atypical 2-Cys peroxiredoxin) [Pricia antarctica]|uniref:Thiol peroxidase n=1 Tax=Pricia antarctica TaxID=641691 RepID=A0A1G7EID5_9FLAO|nr:thiol peroxidase [Pricia antarctica]SDE63225.1 thiol peroxidase (atypical 2-Cys peroxiredoxin) [Pricia antarctica]